MGKNRHAFNANWDKVKYDSGLPELRQYIL